MRRLAACLTLLACAPLALAQDPAEAEAVALAFQTAYETNDHEAAAALLSDAARERVLAAPATIDEVDPFMALTFEDREDVASVFAILDEMVSSEPGMEGIEAEALDGLRIETLGHVATSPDSVYVLIGTRLTLFDQVVTGVVPVTTTWDGGRWGVELPFELATVLAIFEAYASDPERVEAVLMGGEATDTLPAGPRDPKKGR